MDAQTIKEEVRSRYGEISKQSSSCGCGCCGTSQADEVGTQVGYSTEEMGAVPDGANLGLGCGNPVALAELRPGDTVLDLGSGGGFDCFLAARAVGETGRVIGIDMTPEMLERARANARKGGYENVEFRQGEIEALPVDDASVDVIISNCVINLSPDKPRVFAEAFRVLKPGGKLFVSDLVLLRKLPGFVSRSMAAYAGCVAGALLRDDYLDAIRGAGFQDVDVLGESPYTLDIIETFPGLRPWARLARWIPPLRRTAESVVSLKVTAQKA